MKDAMIKLMEEAKQNLLLRLTEESGDLNPDETDQVLDSILEINKILEALIK